MAYLKKEIQVIIYTAGKIAFSREAACAVQGFFSPEMTNRMYQMNMA